MKGSAGRQASSGPARARAPGIGSAFVFGAGKAGRALAAALRRIGVRVSLRAARRGLPRAIDADLVVLAVRDAEIGPVAEAIARRGLLGIRRAGMGVVVAHLAGALGPEPLAPLREAGARVARMHPLIAFASTRRAPSLAGAHLSLDGDPAAVRALARLGRRLGMAPRAIPGLDLSLYHAAAALVANGAAALASAGCAMLERAGVPPREAPRMLGPLLSSVAENVGRLGLPAALTGPVRRGDAAAIERHAAIVGRALPELLPLYLAVAEVQLPLARTLAEAPASHFDALARSLAHLSRPSATTSEKGAARVPARSGRGRKGPAKAIAAPRRRG